MNLLDALIKQRIYVITASYRDLLSCNSHYFEKAEVNSDLAFATLMRAPFPIKLMSLLLVFPLDYRTLVASYFDKKNNLFHRFCLLFVGRVLAYLFTLSSLSLTWSENE